MPVKSSQRQTGNQKQPTSSWQPSSPHQQTGSRPSPASPWQDESAAMDTARASSKAGPQMQARHRTVLQHSGLLTGILLFILLLLIGVVGYIYLLHLNLIDALYMTVITVSTVGYREVTTMNTAAKLFSIFMILGGLAFVGYTFTSLVTFLTEGKLRQAWRERKMNNKIAALEKHYIVCGAGETGQNVIAQLHAGGVPFVVIDFREEKVRELHERGILAIFGDPTHESLLEQAGIRRAEGLISALPSDTENVFTVLTARYLNKDLYIISRAIEVHAREKLTMAGADRTISPNEIGGRRMAAMVLRPSIFSFLDIVTYAGDDILNLEEVILNSDSPLVNRKLKDAHIPQETGLLVLAIKKFKSSAMVFNPSAEELLECGDSLIVLGDIDKVNELKHMARDEGARIHI